jgi:hypothetical protein
MIAERSCKAGDERRGKPRAHVRTSAEMYLTDEAAMLKFGSHCFPTVRRPKDRGVPSFALRSACQRTTFVLFQHNKCLSPSPFRHRGRFVFVFVLLLFLFLVYNNNNFLQHVYRTLESPPTISLARTTTSLVLPLRSRPPLPPTSLSKLTEPATQNLPSSLATWRANTATNTTASPSRRPGPPPMCSVLKSSSRTRSPRASRSTPPPSLIPTRTQSL